MTSQQPDDVQEKERLGEAGWRRRAITVHLNDLKPGMKVELADGVGEVVDNPLDGAWIVIKYLKNDEDPSKVGEVEPIFAEYVYGALED